MNEKMRTVNYFELFIACQFEQFDDAIAVKWRSNSMSVVYNRSIDIKIQLLQMADEYHVQTVKAMTHQKGFS